ncbi:MAG: hypothetical protein HQL32_14645, partial [Planctomycetes bacterium]|nr:hypothetical protein [Planctomycetota bacterium]
MSAISRRQCLSTVSALGCSALGAYALGSAPVSGKRFELALSQYSLRALIKNGSLDPIDFPAYCLENFGIKAIDYWEGGVPKNELNNMKYWGKIRNIADNLGVDIFLLMTNPFDAKPGNHEKSIKKLLPSIERASVLG